MKDDPLANTAADDRAPTVPGAEPGTRSFAGGAADPPGIAAAGDGLPIIDPAHYRRGEEIGRGGMGRITSAVDRRLGREVALKEAARGDAVAAARFEREAVITARLQHPAIVPIYEAGRWPSGEPFYAMRRVEGRSLQAAIADAASAGERLALLRHVIAASEAVAYAHRHGIVHRDLKPANVLVGELGETVVIDWGLAKDRNGPDPDSPGSAAGALDPGLTVAGRALGTPAYMPPEQARGEAVDERGDVYALGALLYHVLTGRPPYRGGLAEETLDEVLRGPPPVIEELAPEVPAELATIAGKAMARSPADRYPSARELAQELVRFQTGQLVRAHAYSGAALLRRWLRRHRAAVAVAAVLLTALAATGIVSVGRILREKRRADANAALARKQRGAAEQLVEFVLFDMRDRLDGLGRVDLLAGLGGEVDAYYDGVANAGGGLDREAQRRRAAALLLTGDVQYEQGDLAAATRSYQTSSDMLAALARDRPADALLLRTLGASLGKRAKVERESGRGAAAEALYGDALAAYREAGLLAADDATAWSGLAGAHGDLGLLLLDRGSLAAAELHMRIGLALREGLAADAGGDVERAKALAIAHGSLADLLVYRGDAVGALAELGAALAILDRWATARPDDEEIDELRADYRSGAGSAAMRQGELDTARDHLRAALALTERLARLEPSSAQRRGEVANTHLRLAEIERERGERAAARAETTAALALYQELTAGDPANTFWRNDLAIAHCQLAASASDEGDHAAALREFARCAALREALVAGDPANQAWSSNLARVYVDQSAVLRAAGRPREALAASRRALPLFERVAAADPDDAAAQSDLSAGLASLGAAQLALGDVAGAVESFRRAVDLARRLVAARPDNVYFEVSLSESMEQLAGALFRLRADDPEAAALRAEAGALRDRRK